MNRLEKFQKKLSENPTKAEKEIMSILSYWGIKYNFQRIFDFEDIKCIVDFYIPAVKIVFEIDGKQHRTNEYIFVRDVKKEIRLFKENHINVFRFNNEDVFNHRYEVMVDIIIIIGSLMLSKASLNPHVFYGKIKTAKLRNFLTMYEQLKERHNMEFSSMQRILIKHYWQEDKAKDIIFNFKRR